MSTDKKITGLPSVDKPWMDKYPDSFMENRRHYVSIYENLRSVWKDENEVIINYYDSSITVGEFFDRVSCIAKSLCVMGVKEGDSIAASLESVPEFLELFLACELLGCSVKNFIESPEDSIELIQSCSSDIYIAHDYITQKNIDIVYDKTKIKHIIVINPFYSATDMEGIRENIWKAVQERYKEQKSSDNRNMEWGDFLRLSEKITVLPIVQKGNILLSAFTSGTEGKPKEVLHTSESLLGVISQLALFPSHEKGKDTWLLTILPPTLVAIVVAMMFYPLADGKQLILDPFCKIEDLDIEMMHYEPNCWGLIPIFFRTLLESKRIPANYNMSYFKLFGFGAEPMTQRFILQVQEFLDRHNCKAPFSAGYGQSEGGSDFTVCIGREMISSGSAGIPLIDTTISIFEHGTTKELGYNEVGEICKTGPGIMVGYADQEQTKEVLKMHPDGKLWLHTGDYGFMTCEGLLYVLGRKGIKVFPDKVVYPVSVENKVLTFSKIKEAILVSGKDSVNLGFEVPYLFVVLDKDKYKEDSIMSELETHLSNVLLPEEMPAKIYVINEKPISHFKTDRKYLQKKYEL